ncbi:galactokinase [Spirochaetia bacterium]|nr:galactokinase [Spirochaetia bacterium]
MLDIGAIHRAEYELDTDRPGRAHTSASAPTAAEPVVIAEAPGRIHYLGDHGEPKAGLFLSSAIDRHIHVAVSARKDNSIRFFAADLGERKRTTLINLKYKREDRWANFIKVAIHIFDEMGYPVKGLNFTVCGDIPQQIGLASSAAMEVAAAAALRSFLKVSMSDKELIRRLGPAHELYFGTESPTVDYLIILSARKDHFVLADEALGLVQLIKSPFSRCTVLVMDSRVPRMDIEEELKQRRLKIKKGLELLSRKREGASFREFAALDLVESMGNLPEEIRRRSMHVVQELRRVADAADALSRADMASLNRLIFHSHESLRDLYEVSCPEIDWLVKRAQETEGVFGSRMTGQGFGGCTYTFIKDKALGDYAKRLEEYERIFGFRPIGYELKIGTGARVLAGRK